MSGGEGRPLRVAGAILAGGRSRRMGRDKAFVEVGDVPLVARSAAALSGAGIDTVRVIGGDAAAFAAVGLTVVPDRWPGEGPLGGLLTALGHDDLAGGPGDGGERVVVVLTCDLAAITADDVLRLLGALGDDASALVAAPRSGGHLQLLTAAWRTAAAPVLRGVFDAGERSVRRSVGAAGLSVAVVEGIPADHLVDVDTPADLAALRLPGDLGRPSRSSGRDGASILRDP